jgi:hypothetical protein
MSVKLIDILVRDLDKFGGWPEEAVECHRFVDEANIDFYDKDGQWWNDCFLKYGNFAQEAVRERVITCESESVTREQYEAALAASKPVWDGKGLPPVGCVCEYETKFDGWQPVRIELIKSEGIAFTWLANSQAYNGLDCVGVQKSGSFRPIRSEADKKKEAAVFAIAELCRDSASNGHSAELIYDAIKSGKIVID